MRIGFVLMEVFVAGAGVMLGSEMTPLPAVMAEPGKSVWVPILKPELELPVRVVPPATMTTGDVEAGAGMPEVWDAPLMIIAPEELREICCPLTVIALLAERV